MTDPIPIANLHSAAAHTLLFVRLKYVIHAAFATQASHFQHPQTQHAEQVQLLLQQLQQQQQPQQPQQQHLEEFIKLQQAYQLQGQTATTQQLQTWLGGASVQPARLGTPNSTAVRFPTTLTA